MASQKELKLQSEIAVAFSDKWPDKRGQLMRIVNENASMYQRIIAKATGVAVGAADFLFFSKQRNVATEIKYPGESHSVFTVKRQLKWGKVWESQGNVWRLCRNVKEAMSCYKGKYKGLTIEEVESMIEGKSKTSKVKF